MGVVRERLLRDCVEYREGMSARTCAVVGFGRGGTGGVEVEVVGVGEAAVGGRGFRPTHCLHDE